MSNSIETRRRMTPREATALNGSPCLSRESNKLGSGHGYSESGHRTFAPRGLYARCPLTFTTWEAMITVIIQALLSGLMSTLGRETVQEIFENAKRRHEEREARRHKAEHSKP